MWNQPAPSVWNRPFEQRNVGGTDDPWAQPLSMSGGMGGRPGTQQVQQQGPVQLTPQQQYGQRMQQLDLAMKQMNYDNSWQLNQFKNQRFAGANAGATTGSVLYPSWAAQDWLGKYMYRNLGLSEPTFNSASFSKMPNAMIGSGPLQGRR